MPNWSDVLDEIQRRERETPNPPVAIIHQVRKEYLQALANKTGRNVIAYYSGFLSKPGIQGLGIDDEDKNGFMSAIYKMDRKNGLDLLLHTPGGNIAATQSVVYYLHKMFGRDIRAIIPQIALSAGAMLACSCKSIVMGHHSSLGPIDPQLRDIPAQGVIQEFRRAYREIKRDATKTLLWENILGKYQPTFLSQCEQAVKWSNSFVTEQLSTVMFHGAVNAKQKAAAIVKTLSDYRKNPDHSRHIHADECRALGLHIEQLEGDPELQERVLSVHHAFIILLMNTPTYKIIENHQKSTYIKFQNVAPIVPNIVLQPPIPMPRPTQLPTPAGA